MMMLAVFESVPSTTTWTGDFLPALTVSEKSQGITSPIFTSPSSMSRFISLSSLTKNGGEK